VSQEKVKAALQNRGNIVGLTSPKKTLDYKISKISPSSLSSSKKTITAALESPSTASKTTFGSSEKRRSSNDFQKARRSSGNLKAPASPTKSAIVVQSSHSSGSR
jgi:hypothetical protein